MLSETANAHTYTRRRRPTVTRKLCDASLKQSNTISVTGTWPSPLAELLRYSIGGRSHGPRRHHSHPTRPPRSPHSAGSDYCRRWEVGVSEPGCGSGPARGRGLAEGTYHSRRNPSRVYDESMVLSVDVIAVLFSFSVRQRLCEEEDDMARVSDRDPE